MTDYVNRDDSAEQTVPTKRASGLDHLLELALTNNAAIDVIERMAALRDKELADIARADYDEAMCKFQSEIPTIKKTTKSFNSYYAKIEAIVEQVREPLARNGFSYSTETVYDPVKELCTAVVHLTHISGHSRIGTHTSPLLPKTNSMNQAQVVAGTLTFCKRYAFCNVTGVMTGDDDSDGRSAGQEYMSTEQYTEMKQLLDATRNTEAKVVELCRVRSITQITTSQATAIIAQLKRMLERSKEDGTTEQPTDTTSDSA